MLCTTMMPMKKKLQQSKYRSEVIEQGDPIFAASEYADYEQGYDQWQIWAQQSQRQRRTISSRRRSLLSGMIDPRVERHMRFVPDMNDRKKEEKHTSSSTMAVPTMMAARRRWHKNVSRHDEKRAGTAEYCLVDEKKDKKKDGSVCSTKAPSESDDSSYELVSAPAAVANDPVVEETASVGTPNGLQMTHSMFLEQEAMINAMEMKHEHRHCGVAAEPPKNPTNAHQRCDNGQVVTLLPNDRVKRALKHGESIRIIKCSGCCRELLVMPDLPLVYCPYCECFSHLEAR